MDKKTNKFIFIIILVFLPLLPIYSSSTLSLDATSQVNSLFVADKSGDVSHLQITEKHSKLIWKKNYGVLNAFHKVEISDIDNNNELEVLFIHPNDGLYLSDFKTGELIWDYKLPSAESQIKSLEVGDLTGDAFEEILVVLKTPISYSDNSIIVIDHNGNTITKFKSPNLSVNSFGADNGLIRDLNHDGLNEIILSYGSVLYNRDNDSDGRYLIQSWQWDSQVGNFTNRFNVTGFDNGGNTQISYLSDNNLLFTAGWYNNPVRSFNENGTIIWEKKLFQTNDILRTADTLLQTYNDHNNANHLLVVTNNYWENKTMYVYDINPLSGEENSPKMALGNVSNVKTSLNGNDLLLWYRKKAEGSIYFEGLILNLLTNTTLKIWDDDKPWAFFLSNPSNIVPYLSIGDSSYYLVADENDEIWFTDGVSKYFLSISLAKLAGVFPFNNVNSIEGGEILDNYQENNSKINNAWIYLILISIIAALVFVSRLLFDKFQDYRFHKSFGRNWIENFRLMITNILLSKNQIKLEPVKPKLISDKNPILSYELQTEPKPESQTKVPNIVKFVGSRNGSTVFKFLDKRKDIANRIKVGDLAIMIELLKQFPKSIIQNEISTKFGFASKSTVYKRLILLEELNLIMRVKQNIGVDARTFDIKLTSQGLDLLAILYDNLNSL